MYIPHGVREDGFCHHLSLRGLAREAGVFDWFDGGSTTFRE